MFSEKKAKKILKQQAEQYYEEMAADVEKDIERCTALVDELSSRTLQNEIFIVDNKELFNTNYIGKDEAVRQFNILLANFECDEDLINSRMVLKSRNYELEAESGFTVFYPKFQRDDITSIKAEIISGVAEFIDKVIYSKNESNKRVFYRGHGSWEYKLQPSIYREGMEKILLHESEYIREIISSHPQYFTNCKTALDFLSVLQHNGFPTRLLDFSENPLIALFMACDNDDDKHADTIRIAVPNDYFKYYDSDTVSVLANIAFFDDDFTVKEYFTDSQEEQRELNQNKDIIRLVHQIRNEKPYFEPRILPKHLDGSILFVKSKQSFDRIAQQSGIFALFGICKNKLKMPKIEMMIPPCEITHYIIPANYKKKILEELSCINITKASVYCDLEHISRYYIDKSQNEAIETIINNKEEDELKKLKSLLG